MRFNSFRYIILLTFLPLMCEPSENSREKYDETSGVFICNEGNYTFGNASLSFYDPTIHEVHNQVFFSVNGFPLGDVAYSMTLKDSLGYVVVNNSGKIVVINTSTFIHAGTIGGLTSPRYISILDSHKAYVTDLYSKAISIIDPVSQEVTGIIPVGVPTENMITAGNQLFVTSWSFGDQVYRIDTSTDRVIDSLTVAKQPNSLVIDKDGKLWVLSDGGYPGFPPGQDHAALTRIDLPSFSIDNVLQFHSLSASPHHLQMNSDGDSLFYIEAGWGANPGNGTGVMALSINDEILPEKPLIESEEKRFYSMGLDPGSSLIYLTDAGDYLSKGLVYRFTTGGSLVDSFLVDVIPGNFCFKP